MDIGGLVKQMSKNRPIIRDSSAEYPLETYKGIFSEDQNLYGEDTPTYYVLLIDLLDRAIVDNNLHDLSTEQQELFEHFLKEANTVTQQHTSAHLQDYIEPEMSEEEYKTQYKQLSRAIKKLDEFLGSYFGVDDGQYSRYTKKQFYSKRQPFSQKITNITGA